MVFLREGGKDDLSILLEKGRLDPANATAAGVCGNILLKEDCV